MNKDKIFYLAWSPKSGIYRPTSRIEPRYTQPIFIIIYTYLEQEKSHSSNSRIMHLPLIDSFIQFCAKIGLQSKCL